MFQTTIEKLGALLSFYSTEDVKFELITTSLTKEYKETKVYLDYIKREKLDFEQACAHIRETALMDAIIENNKP